MNITHYQDNTFVEKLLIGDKRYDVTYDFWVTLGESSVVIDDITIRECACWEDKAPFPMILINETLHDDIIAAFPKDKMKQEIEDIVFTQWSKKSVLS